MPRSVWELIDRRADASPDRIMLHRRRPRARRSREYRDMVLAAAAGFHALGVGDRHERVVAAADVDGVGGARRRAVPARRGAEPDAADLPATARSASSPQQTHCSLLITPSEWNRFDYAGLAQQVAAEQPGLHDARRRPPQPDRRSVDAAAAATVDRRPRGRAGALDLLHVGHDGGAEGRARTPTAP